MTVHTDLWPVTGISVDEFQCDIDVSGFLGADTKRVLRTLVDRRAIFRAHGNFESAGGGKIAAVEAPSLKLGIDQEKTTFTKTAGAITCYRAAAEEQNECKECNSSVHDVPRNC